MNMRRAVRANRPLPRAREAPLSVVQALTTQRVAPATEIIERQRGSDERAFLRRLKAHVFRIVPGSNLFAQLACRAGTIYFMAQELNDRIVRSVVIAQRVRNAGLNGCRCRHKFTTFAWNVCGTKRSEAAHSQRACHFSYTPRELFQPSRDRSRCGGPICSTRPLFRPIT